MHRGVWVFALVGLSSGVAAGLELDGRTIRLVAGAHGGRNVPVSLPFDGPVPTERVTVVEEDTGAVFPAGVYEGRLVFVADALEPGSTHRYGVRVRGKVRGHGVTVKKQRKADALEVRLGKDLFTVYHYSEEYKKPFLWPLLGEGDVPLTRDYPMAPSGRSRDHPHHKSLWSAHGDVNGVDCWGEARGAGIQRTEEVTWGPGDAYGWIRAKNVWQDGAGKPVVREEREYRFYHSVSPGLRIFDLEITFTASFGDVTFGDTKEGGMVALRVRPEIQGNRGGVITNALGGKGEAECWGKAAAWCDYSGSIEGAGIRGVAVLDHPGNLRHPTRWHVRDYGLMGANCFGLSYFVGEGENGDYRLREDESLRFRYRVYVHSGDAGTARVAERFADFASPPKVEWVD